MAEKVEAFRQLVERRTTAGDAGGRDLDALYQSGALRGWIDHHTGNVEAPRAVGMRVPLINKVAAGYPTDFTDMDYPARVADEYVAVPDLEDAGAFAARVVGESMMPDYREGETIDVQPRGRSRRRVRLLHPPVARSRHDVQAGLLRKRRHDSPPAPEPRRSSRGWCTATAWPGCTRRWRGSQTIAPSPVTDRGAIVHHKGSGRPNRAHGLDAQP
jgi:hypothetical protein